MALIPRLKRLAGYASWSAVDQLVKVALPRLVLFPILASLMGNDEFGKLILALSVIQMIGNSPSNGLAGYIIRDVANHDEDRQRELMRTVLSLCVMAMIVVCVAIALGSGSIATIWREPVLSQLIPLLAVYLLLNNVIHTALTVYRVRRTFATMAFIHAVETAFLFLAIPLYLLVDLPGVCIAYIAAAVGALVVIGIKEGRGHRSGPWLSRTFVRRAMKVWLPITIATFVTMSARYLDRLALGYWWSAEDVAIFFAAAGTARVFSAPAAQINSLVLSLLGKVKRLERFSRRFYVYYGLGVVAFAILILVIGVACGRPMLTLMYPEMKEQALPLWNWAVVSAAALTLVSCYRPFGVKFLSPSLIPIVATLGVIGRLAPLFILVPSGGRVGAVQALCIGSGILATMWSGVFIRFFILGRGGTTTGDGPGGDRDLRREDDLSDGL